MILQSNKPLFHTLAELETGPETEPRAEPKTFSDGRTGFGAHVSSADTYDDSQFSVLSSQFSVLSSQFLSCTPRATS
jgi:hypothetical protein